MKKNNGWLVIALGLGALAFYKIKQRKEAFKNLAEEFNIKKRGPIGVMERVRQMSNEEFAKFKDSLKEKFPRLAGCRKHAHA